MDIASLILRLSLGTMFTAHGLQKVFGIFGGSGIDGFSVMLSRLGFAPALFWAYLAGYVELIGGLFLILGIYVRSTALSLLILIAVAAVKVHIAKGFFLPGGFEYVFIIFSVCLALIIMGGGRFSTTKKF
jgi:putative oxidoreductase